MRSRENSDHAMESSKHLKRSKASHAHLTDAHEHAEAATMVTDMPNQPIRRRSISTPHNMIHLQVPGCSDHSDVSDGSKKKKRFSFRKLFKRGDHHSSHENLKDDSTNANDPIAIDANQRQTELEFAHTLMSEPRELGVDLCRADSEPDLVQTVCDPSCFSKEAIRLDKKLYQLDAANARCATLSRLSATAVLARDHQALEFLVTTLKRIRKQSVTLFKEADKYLTQFKKDPTRLMIDSSRRSEHSHDSVNGSDEDDKVTFLIQDENEDVENVRWEMNSLNFSTDNTSSDSDDEGPAPEAVEHLAKEIRRTEGTRFKRKHKFHRGKGTGEHESAKSHMPPPPNPLGHSRRALLRSHATVPNGLCYQDHSSAASMASLIQTNDTNHARRHKDPTASNLPFNLLSLTGQLSWLVSEYIDRTSSTYKWATDLTHSISRMSVTRATWLNVHQQLRETTELLYAHRNTHQTSVTSATAKGEIAWNHLQTVHQSLDPNDGNSTTVTAESAKRLLNSVTKQVEKKLVHLSVLFEKKFHLAYVCDLILWRAHKILFAIQAESPQDTAKHQLIDFRIRHMQLRLDQANVQNWSAELIDAMTRWINEMVQRPHTARKKSMEDSYYVDQLNMLKLSITRFQHLVHHIGASEFLSEKYLHPERKDDDRRGSDSQSDGSDSRSQDSHSHHQHHHHHHHHHHQHYRPHLHHHGQGGHQQDLRPMDADRCSHTYSALVRQIHEHAMSKRPLGYFAERALYDIAMELECAVDWKERMLVLLDELVSAYHEWELLLQSRFPKEFSDSSVVSTIETVEQD